MGKKQKRNKRIADMEYGITSLRKNMVALQTELAHFEFLLQATMAEVRTHIISKIDVEKLAEQERAIVAKWNAEPADMTDSAPTIDSTGLQGKDTHIDRDIQGQRH